MELVSFFVELDWCPIEAYLIIILIDEVKEYVRNVLIFVEVNIELFLIVPHYKTMLYFFHFARMLFLAYSYCHRIARKFNRKIHP